jgi:hypothetical protein
MPSATSITTNNFTLGGPGLLSASIAIGGDPAWFILYSSMGCPVSVAFDQDAPLPCDVRAVFRRKFSKVTFTRRDMFDANPCVGYFLYGKGEPPDYPSVQDADCNLFPLAPASTIITGGPGGFPVIEGFPLGQGDYSQIRAYWISVDRNAPNGVYVQSGQTPLAQGMYLNPGDPPIRILSGGYGLLVYNADASTVQTHIAVEILK